MDPDSRVEGTHFEQLPGYQMPAVAAAVYEESLGLQLAEHCLQCIRNTVLNPAVGIVRTAVSLTIVASSTALCGQWYTRETREVGAYETSWPQDIGTEGSMRVAPEVFGEQHALHAGSFGRGHMRLHCGDIHRMVHGWGMGMEVVGFWRFLSSSRPSCQSKASTPISKLGSVITCDYTLTSSYNVLHAQVLRF